MNDDVITAMRYPHYNSLVDDEPNFIFRVSNAVGYIVLFPNIHLQVTKKPNWFHRTMIRLFFGWKYVSLNTNDKVRQLLYD